MKYLFGLVLVFTAATAFAQQQERPLVQFTGLVHNADSTDVIVPYVSITNKSFRNQASQSNYEGYFSFVVHERDTLTFTCVGYASVTVVIPANLPSKSFTKQISLKAVIINLPAFRVFPWATTDEFRTDFLTLKVADDDLEIARKNLSVTKLMYEVHTMVRDGSEPINVQSVHNDQMNSHSTVNPLLNPFAWGALIKQINEGAKGN